MEHDYNVCPATADGKHVPGDGYDREQPKGYLTVECSVCRQTTGVAIPDPSEIEWN